MALKMTKIKLNLDGQTIEGTFRGLIAASNTDILLLGNKKSSLLLSFDDLEIKSIHLAHTDQMTNFGDGLSNKSVSTYLFNKKRVVTEIYEPHTKQQAFSILTSIYTKYKGSKSTIDTEGFDNIYGGFQYKITGTNTQSTYPSTMYRKKDESNYQSNSNHFKTQPTNLKPKITKDEGITEFMNKVLGGYKYERDYREKNYFEQLN